MGVVRHAGKGLNELRALVTLAARSIRGSSYPSECACTYVRIVVRPQLCQFVGLGCSAVKQDEGSGSETIVSWPCDHPRIGGVMSF
jgi:hypothetical protein